MRGSGLVPECRCRDYHTATDYMIDGQQSDEQYMRELYQRFLAGVKDSDNSEFYEEDELLDIYDYAQDEGDEMVQLYVLLAGARLYPDSDFLDERKAFFLSAINSDAARNMFERRGREDSALWRVLKLSLDTYPDGNPEEGLTDLLAADLRFSCEAVIRLIDMLHDLNRDDLIAGNLHILREKADTPALLYYEAAEALYHNEQYAITARNLADELTQQEPFNPDNWILLAKIELALQHSAECVAAADYALAIDPANQRALLVKGVGLIAADETTDEGVSILRGVLAQSPENSFAAKAIAEAYSRQGKNGAALEVYSSFMEHNPGEPYVILDILKLHPSDPDRYLQMYALAEGDNERKWLEVAAQLVNDGEVEAAVTMLEFYHKTFILKEGMEYYLQVLYRAHRYQDYALLFGKCCSEARQPGATAYAFSANAYLLLASSYLMAALYEEAVKICDLMLKDPPPANDYDEHLRWKGMQLTLTFIRNLAEEPELIPHRKDFDPITFPIPLGYEKKQ